MTKECRRGIARRALGALLAAFAACAHGLGHAATPAVSTGDRHSLALHADGAVRAWGDDSSGQLGLGRVLYGATPAAVIGLSDVVQVDSGFTHVVVRRRDGTVWAWGENTRGELGDGSTASRSAPAPVEGLSGITAVAAGGSHSLALKDDGTVWSWGVNYVGQLGYEDNATLRPARVPGLPAIAAVSAGTGHSLALARDGTVWAWGGNDTGELGDGTFAEPFTGRTQPRPVAGLSGVVSISAGHQYSLAAKDDGTVLIWGWNYQGFLLGDAAGARQARPVPVAGITGARSVSAGIYHALVLLGDGSVRAWGDGYSGQLGDGRSTPSTSPVPVIGLAGVTEIAAGFLFSMARTEGGAVWAWGLNEFGQLGDGTTQMRTTPVRVNGLPAIAAIGAGGNHGFAVAPDGRVFAWGSNDFGELGDGIRSLRSTPSLVPGVAGIKAVAAGGLHSLALRDDGTILAWGSNSQGQLGDGTQRSRSTAATVPGISGVRAIAAGYYHSMALKDDGTVWMWGYGFEGQLGNGTNRSSESPAQVAGLAGIVAIATGGAHALALGTDGTLWAWGGNTYGQLGDATNAQRLVPVRVSGTTGLSRIREISAGERHTLVLTTDATVWSWGANYSGELGDGSNRDRNVPGIVPGFGGVSSIAAGSSFSLARKGDGSAWSWGANWAGQLGDGSGYERQSPVAILGMSGIAALSAGGRHGLALKADGTAWMWGANVDGRLGDGTFIDRLSPAVVLREGGAGNVATNDWFLDLNPAIAKSIPPEKVPVFLVVASGAGGEVSAQLRYRAEDVGTVAGTYVFALAPADVVKTAKDGSAPMTFGKTVSRGGSKALSVACVLSQLNASGQLQAVTPAQLQAYLTGVLSGLGQSVPVVGTTGSVSIGGATFYVGYGSSPSGMLGGGLTRSVITLPGARECRPQAPQTGWWWNAAEGGRGYSIEVAGNNIFYAAFLYDESGRSNWFVATGRTSLDGSFFTGPLYAVRNGQTLFGPYRAPDPVTTAGTLTLTFDDASHATMVWPGGAIPIERFNIIPNGLATAPPANRPENGWWWNPAESGRGFFIEWQDGTGGPHADLAGYMYDDAGNPVWYLSLYPTPDPRFFSGNWWSYANGQTLTGAYRPATRVSDNVAPVTIQFHSATTATMTLPGGRTVSLTRHRF